METIRRRPTTRDTLVRGALARGALPALLAGAALLALAPARPAAAQFPDRLKEAAKSAAEREVTDQVRDFVRNAVKCVFDDLDCIRKAQADDEDVVLTDEDGEVMYDDEGQPVTDPEELPAEKRPRVADSYDFEPGERTIFETDLAGVHPGDFPRRLAYLYGNMEVAETPGGRFVRGSSGFAGFAVALPETLPERFTIEFEGTDPNGGGIFVLLTPPKVPGSSNSRFREPQHAFFRAPYGIVGPDHRPISTSTARESEFRRGILPVRIMVDGQHAKMFVGRTRVANVPRVDLGRSDSVYFYLNGYRSDVPMVGKLRIAAGGRDLYEAIEAEGHVAVRDILFDTGKADIRPASAQVLGTIADMLEEHPDLRLLIEGHTDGQGGFDMNMDLSSDRADAVKAWLVEKEGVEADRLRTVGLGPSRPVADNGTEAGRRKNRRVELVRIGGGR